MVAHGWPACAKVFVCGILVSANEHDGYNASVLGAGMV
jgi:hypothetical protein